MAYPNAPICDVCGITKGEGNKWLVGWVASHGYALADWPESYQSLCLPPYHHLCGEACALKMQARYLRQI